MVSYACLVPQYLMQVSKTQKLPACRKRTATEHSQRHVLTGVKIYGRIGRPDASSGKDRDMNKYQLDKIQNLLDDMVKTRFAAGASCLVFQGGTEQGYYESGFASLENEIPFRRDTICHMYSMSKPITSAAVMLLLQDGRLDLMQPLSEILPAFAHPLVVNPDGSGLMPSPKEITIRDLLAMTSGYTYGGTADAGRVQTSALIAETIRRMDADPLTTMDFMNRLAAVPLSFIPGTSFEYGLSADILGAVVEAVSGRKFSSFLNEHIFRPLHMDDTGFYVPAAKQHRLAKIYCKDTLSLYTDANLAISNDMYTPPAFESGGAGIVSTIDDYMRFNRMLLNRGTLDGVKILEPGTVTFMRTQSLTPVQQAVFDAGFPQFSGYTYGNLMRVMIKPELSQSISSAGEYGWDGWLGTYMMIDPARDLCVVFMQQLTDSGTTTCTRRLRNIIYSACSDRF